MCGIVGFTGNAQAAPILLDGLERLEKSVYTIILYEKSPKQFHEFPHTYLHYFQQKSDTGLDLELLQK